VSRSENGDFEGYLRAEFREAVAAMPGLKQKQMLQTAVSSTIIIRPPLIDGHQWCAAKGLWPFAHHQLVVAGT
jgi:hypothetical protein